MVIRNKKQDLKMKFAASQLLYKFNQSSHVYCQQEVLSLMSQEKIMGNISRKSFLQKAISREDYRQFLKEEFAHVLPGDIPPTVSNIVEHMQDNQIQAINRLFNRLKKERFAKFEDSMTT